MSALVLFASPGIAGSDSDLKKPYNLQVVLHLAEHRALSSTFREDLTRQIGDFLRLNFGQLAHVEVAHTHPLLNEVLAKGLQQALDGWDELSDTRTCFVLIDLAGGRYRIRARQHDGATNLSSAVVQEEETGDREAVGSKVARLLDQNFSPSGTVLEASANSVKIALRGGALGNLKRWLRPGDVFAVARIAQEGEKRRAQRVDWALLQAQSEPHEGVCVCRYYRRYQEDDLRPEPGVVYRCLKLHTVTRPLRLRLLDEKTDASQDGLQVHIEPTTPRDERRELTTGRDGLVVTPNSYHGMALVRVLSGVGQVGQFPVAIVDQHTVVCRLSMKPEAVQQAQLALRADRWLSRILDNLRMSDERVGRLNALLARSPEDALAQAGEGLKSLNAALASLTEERDALRAAIKDGEKIDLGEGELRLAELQKRRSGLEPFMARLQAVIREAPRIKALKSALERVVLLQAQADFDAAIDLYKKILADNPDEPKVKEQLERLEKQWQVRGPRHKEARQFLYEVWPKKMDTAALKTNLPNAHAMFLVCKQEGDRLTPLKILKADLAHATYLKQRLETLRHASASEDNRAEKSLIAELAVQLGALNAQVSAFLKEETAP